MKKLLLSLLAVAGLSLAASAAEVTFDFKGSDNVYGLTRTSDGNGPYVTDATLQSTPASLTLAKTAGNGFRLWTDGLRVYRVNKSTVGKASITVAVSNATITNVDMVMVGTKKFDVVKFDDGTAVTPVAKAGNNVYSWTGSAATTVINIETKNNLSVGSIKITYTPNGDENKDAAGLSFDETSFTANLKDGFTAPELKNPNNLDVIYSSSYEAVATVAADGKVTLVGAGTTTITARSAETGKFNAGEAFYTLKVVKTYDTVAEFYTVGKDGKGIIGFDLIVTYVKGQNCYAQTEDGEYTLIFGSTPYAVNDVIPAGWEGQYSPFNGLDEIKPVGTMPAAAGTTTFAPDEVTSVSKADMNRVVILKGVKFEAATATGTTKTNFYGTVNDVTYTFRNNFADVPSVEAGVYDVELAVSYYEKNGTGTLQLYPIKYTEVTTTGIDGVIVDENAPVEYYNLQGVRVANPENGLYIRRQGNKATKVLVK